jgi:hypothetical protein
VPPRCGRHCRNRYAPTLGMPRPRRLGRPSRRQTPCWCPPLRMLLGATGHGDPQPVQQRGALPSTAGAPLRRGHRAMSKTPAISKSTHPGPSPHR